MKLVKPPLEQIEKEKDTFDESGMIIGKTENRHMYIHRLSMFKTDRCMICKKEYPYQMKVLNVGSWGWLYCDECFKTERIHESAKHHIRTHNLIPLNWIFQIDPSVFSSDSHSMHNLLKTLISDDIQSPNITPTVFPNSVMTISKPQSAESESIPKISFNISFYRHSKRDSPNPIHVSQLICADPEGNWIKYDPTNKLVGMNLKFQDNDTNKYCERFVSLSNIFAHTPKLFELFIKCDDLFCSDVKIGYDDISEFMRVEIMKAYVASMESKEPFLI